jgi:hypothetical protein
MTSGAQTWVGQFVEVGWGFHDLLLASRVFFLAPGHSWHCGGRHLSYPSSKRVELKLPYVCLGGSNHTYINNMISRWNVQLQQSNISYIMTRRSQKDYWVANNRYTKHSIASTCLTIGEAHLAFLIGYWCPDLPTGSNKSWFGGDKTQNDPASE